MACDYINANIMKLLLSFLYHYLKLLLRLLIGTYSLACAFGT